MRIQELTTTPEWESCVGSLRATSLEPLWDLYCKIVAEQDKFFDLEEQSAIGGTEWSVDDIRYLRGQFMKAVAFTMELDWLLNIKEKAAQEMEKQTNET